MSNRPKAKQTPSARVAAAQASARPGRTMWWIVGVVAVVIVGALVVAMVVASRSNTTNAGGTIKGGGTIVPSGPLNYGDVSVTGDALPAIPESGGPDPAIGKAVPKLAGEQFNGAPLTIPATGKPKVVMFVAHWCPHCQKEVPQIAQYLADNGMPPGVDLYAVTTSTSDQRPNFPPSEWLVKANWPVPTMADDEKNRAATAYGVGGFPFFVVVDANGKVIDRTSGELTNDQFQHLVDEARASSPTIAATSSTAPAS